MYTFTIYKDDKVIKEFEHQDSDYEVFKFMLRHQPNSIHHALKYEGYKVTYLNEDDGSGGEWKLYE